MKFETFHLKIREKKVFFEIREEYQQESNLANEMSEEEAYVVNILQKVLNIQLPLKEVAVMERADFAKLGKKLSNILFAEQKIKITLSRKFERAREEKEYRCRIILEFDKSHAKIAALPWEYLCFEVTDEYGDLTGAEEFLSADSQCSFDLIRKIPFSDQDNSGQDSEGLKLNEIALPAKVLVLSCFSDQHGLSTHAKRIKSDFSALKTKFGDKVDIKYLEQCSFSSFKQSLQEMIQGTGGQAPFVPDVIHIAGRGKLEQGLGKIAFVKRDVNGSFVEEWVSDQDFANIFDTIQKPKLVFLQINEGAKIADYQNNQGLALQLLSKKIPSIVAIQTPLPDWIAREFVKEVYQHFMQNLDIANAVTLGRYHLACVLEIPDHEGNTKEAYAHKAFGSPGVFISTPEPVVIYHEEEINIEVSKETTQKELDPFYDRIREGRKTLGEKQQQAGTGRMGDSPNRGPQLKSNPSTSSQKSSLPPTSSSGVVEDASASRANPVQQTQKKSKRLQDLQEKVRKKILKGELLEAVKLVFENLSQNSSIYDKVLNDNSRLNTASTNRENGIMKLDDFQVVENEVRINLLGILRKLSDSDLI